jgi:hypothetical protein
VPDGREPEPMVKATVAERTMTGTTSGPGCHWLTITQIDARPSYVLLDGLGNTASMFTSSQTAPVIWCRQRPQWPLLLRECLPPPAWVMAPPEARGMTDGACCGTDGEV